MIVGEVVVQCYCACLDLGGPGLHPWYPLPLQKWSEKLAFSRWGRMSCGCVYPVQTIQEAHVRDGFVLPKLPVALRLNHQPQIGQGRPSTPEASSFSPCERVRSPPGTSWLITNFLVSHLGKERISWTEPRLLSLKTHKDPNLEQGQGLARCCLRGRVSPNGCDAAVLGIRQY